MVCQVGCGSGAISLSLLHENANCDVVAIDVDHNAVELTRHNATRCGIVIAVFFCSCIVASWICYMSKWLPSLSSLFNFKDSIVSSRLGVASRITATHIDVRNYESTAQFDVLVSNPPYIPSHIIPTLDPHVRLYVVFILRCLRDFVNVKTYTDSLHIDWFRSAHGLSIKLIHTLFLTDMSHTRLWMEVLMVWMSFAPFLTVRESGSSEAGAITYACTAQLCENPMCSFCLFRMACWRIAESLIDYCFNTHFFGPFNLFGFHFGQDCLVGSGSQSSSNDQTVWYKVICLCLFVNTSSLYFDWSQSVLDCLL